MSRPNNADLGGDKQNTALLRVKETASGIYRDLCARELRRAFLPCGCLNGEPISISAPLQLGWSLVLRSKETPNGFGTPYHPLRASKVVLSFDPAGPRTLNLLAGQLVESRPI